MTVIAIGGITATFGLLVASGGLIDAAKFITVQTVTGKAIFLVGAVIGCLGMSLKCVKKTPQAKIDTKV